MVGVIETDEARKMAFEVGLDLVEIAADVRPPVCRIMDHGKFKYEQSKKEKQNKTRSKAGEMKEVRLGRSMKIDPHDVGIRLKQARGFLMEGHRVQIVQNFKGREVAHKSRGDDRMRGIIEALSDIAKVELPPRLNGKRMTMILIGEKPKIDAIKRKLGIKSPKTDSPAKSSSAETLHPTDAAAALSAPAVEQHLTPVVDAIPIADTD